MLGYRRSVASGISDGIGSHHLIRRTGPAPTNPHRKIGRCIDNQNTVMCYDTHQGRTPKVDDIADRQSHPRWCHQAGYNVRYECCHSVEKLRSAATLYANTPRSMVSLHETVKLRWQRSEHNDGSVEV